MQATNFMRFNLIKHILPFPFFNFESSISRKKGCKKKEAQQEGLILVDKDLSEREKDDSIEMQCKLINQMGLTQGGETNQIMGLMADMEKRDSELAAEKGENNFNHDKTVL